MKVWILFQNLTANRKKANLVTAQKEHPFTSQWAGVKLNNNVNSEQDEVTEML
jgi:hypothetical protein